MVKPIGARRKLINMRKMHSTDSLVSHSQLVVTIKLHCMCTCVIVIQRSLNQQFGSHVDKPTYSDDCFSQADFEESAFKVLSSEGEVYISTLCTFLHPGFTLISLNHLRNLLITLQTTKNQIALYNRLSIRYACALAMYIAIHEFL